MIKIKRYRLEKMRGRGFIDKYIFIIGDLFISKGRKWYQSRKVRS